MDAASLAMPLLRLLPPETAHNTTICLLAKGLAPRSREADDPILADAWRTHQQLGQLMACAFDGGGDPDQEPSGFQMRLARTVGAPDFDTLKARLIDLRLRARRAFEAMLPALRDGI